MRLTPGSRLVPVSTACRQDNVRSGNVRDARNKKTTVCPGECDNDRNYTEIAND